MPHLRACLVLLALSACPLSPGVEEPDPGAAAMQQIEAVKDEIRTILDLAAQHKLAEARTACLALEERPTLPDATSDLMSDLAQLPYNAGCYSALQGRSDEAFPALERSVALGFDDAEHISKDSDLESLHADPRFAVLLTHARQRAGTGTVQGTLCEPSIRTVYFTKESQDAKKSDHLAVRIPATRELRERVIWLACTPAQERPLAELMARGKAVRITGSGGTYMQSFRLTVIGFSVADPQ